MSISPDIIYSKSRPLPVLGAGTAAGMMGGLAEVAWIALYGQAGGTPADMVARGVTQSVFPALAAAPSAVWLGLAIHMVIAVALGLAIALVVRRLLPQFAATKSGFAAVVALLMTVWAINFFVVLPVVNPGFVTVVPLAISFISKTLFGIAAAIMLVRR